MSEPPTPGNNFYFSWAWKFFVQFVEVFRIFSQFFGFLYTVSGNSLKFLRAWFRNFPGVCSENFSGSVTHPFFVSAYPDIPVLAVPLSIKFWDPGFSRAATKSLGSLPCVRLFIRIAKPAYPGRIRQNHHPEGAVLRPLTPNEEQHEFSYTILRARPFARDRKSNRRYGL